MPIPIDFDNFLGIHAGETKPPRNSAQILENFDLRGLSGALEVRSGYELLYATRPQGTGLGSIEWKDVENFYVPEVGGGKEITIQVGSAVATSVQNADATYQKDVACVWASHFWNGTDWINKAAADNWDWLNETIFTTIKVIHATDLYKIQLDIVNTAWVAADKFKNYSFVNITTGKVLKVIGTFDYTGNVGIYISSENESFAVGNQIALMRSYIPLEYLEGNSEATKNQVSIVKINNDIKIGFGGYENRVGLTVGYRKSFLCLKNIDFATATLGPIENNIVEIDGLICTPHTALFDNIAIELSTVAETTNPLTQQFYYFRLVAVLDGLSKVMLEADAKIEIAYINKAIEFVISINPGTLNQRITDIEVYIATDANLKVYELLKNIQITDKKERIDKYLLNEFGNLISDNSTTELHSAGLTADDNAASTLTTGDPLTVPHWSVFVGSIAAIADVGAGSDNVIRIYKSFVSVPFFAAVFTPWNGTLEPFTKYNISLFIKLEVGATSGTINFEFENSEPGINGSIHSQSVDNTYIQYEFELETGEFPGTFVISWISPPASCEYRIDQLSIKKDADQSVNSLTVTGDIISDNLGYAPSLNIVKSWDQAKLSSGRIFYVNAWIKERNLNKIFFSHISGLGGASMWDAVTAANYYDTENSDGNDLLGMDILRNLDILTLNSNANLRVDAETGRSLDLGVGSGTENIKAAVNVGSSIIYPSKFDILETNGVSTNPVSFRTVSEKYRSLSADHRAEMRAVREENRTTYRLFLGNTVSKEELLLTPFGWQSAVRSIYPEGYALNRKGTVYFTNGGYVYQDVDGLGDNDAGDIVGRFKSIPIDSELITEMKADDLMVITDFWVFWKGTNFMEISIYLDYAATPFDIEVIDPVGSTKTKYKRPVKLGATCNTVEIGLRSFPLAGGGGKDAGTIFGAGVLVDIIPGRLHA